MLNKKGEVTEDHILKDCNVSLNLKSLQTLISMSPINRIEYKLKWISKLKRKECITVYLFSKKVASYLSNILAHLFKMSNSWDAI